MVQLAVVLGENRMTCLGEKLRVEQNKHELYGVT